MRKLCFSLLALACFSVNAQVQKIEMLAGPNNYDNVFSPEKAKSRFVDAYWNEQQNQLLVFTLKAREGFLNGTNYRDRLLMVHVLDKELKLLETKEFLISKTGEKDEVIAQRVALLEQTYPALFGAKTRKEVSSPFINVAMHGLSFSQYKNTYTASETELVFDPYTMDIKTGQKTVTRDLGTALGYNVFEPDNFPYVTPAGILSTAMSFTSKEDKIAQYKNFHFMSFDQQGSILHHDSASYAFPRGLYRKSPVFNEQMEYTGLSYILYRYPGLGGKKQDPEDTKYDFIRVSTDGRLLHKKTFVYGEKTYAFKPFFSFEKAGKTYVASTNKQGTVLLVFNGQGEYEKTTNVVDDSYVYKTYGPELKFAFWEKQVEFACMYTDKEQNTYVLGRFYQVNKETSPSGVEKTFNTYSDYVLFKLTAAEELNILGSFKDASGVSGTRATPKVQLLSNDGTKASFLFENAVDGTSATVTMVNEKVAFSANQEPGFTQVRNKTWKVQHPTEKTSYFFSVKGNTLLVTKK